MLKQQGKIATGIRLGIGLILTIIVAVLIYAFLIRNHSEKEKDFVFDGWLYNREDQKKATAALSKAGLSDYHWKTGRLLVPRAEKAKYESALTDNSAFPKAPSDIQWESLKEMGQFESESKIRSRELLSCAKQLEQTFEYYEKQIQYATVGVRLRREQVGFNVKNRTTASIGICTQENETLTPELLSAITVAAKHQLGISDNKDISILDFRAGRAYLGTEEAVSNAENASLLYEQKRQELYWKEKFQDALAFIPDIKITTTINLEPLSQKTPKNSQQALILAQTDENGKIDRQSVAYIGFPNNKNADSLNDNLASINHYATQNSIKKEDDSQKVNPNNSSVTMNDVVITTELPANPEKSQNSNASGTPFDEHLIDLQDQKAEATETLVNDSESKTFENKDIFSKASLVPLRPIKQEFGEKFFSDSNQSSVVAGKLKGISVCVYIPESYIELLALREMQARSSATVYSETAIISSSNQETLPPSNATFVVAEPLLSDEKQPLSDIETDSIEKSTTDQNPSLKNITENNIIDKSDKTSEFQKTESNIDSRLVSKNNFSRDNAKTAVISQEIYDLTKDKIVQNIQQLIETLLQPVLKSEGILFDSSQSIRIGFFSDQFEEEPCSETIAISVSKPIIPFKELAQKINRFGNENIGILIPISLVTGALLFATIQWFFVIKRRNRANRQTDQKISSKTIANPNRKFHENSDISKKPDQPINPVSNFQTSPVSSQMTTFPEDLNESEYFYRIDSSEEKGRANILNDLEHEIKHSDIEDELQLNRYSSSESYDVMQQEVSDLISNNPEQAAQIIRKWIRTGT